MNIGGEINKIFEDASPEVEVLATDMLLDMQKLVSKNADIITALVERVIDLTDRVEVLEGRK